MDRADKLTKIYVCPQCRGLLGAIDQQHLQCSGCQKSFLIKDNIPIFAPQLIDQFYEQRVWVTEMELSGKAPLKEKIIWWLYSNFNISMAKRQFIKRQLKNKKGLTLDLACGGGKQYLKAQGPVIGIDICLSALSKAKTIYSSVAQADALALPFVDNLFDFVVSSDFIEHVPCDEKEILFQEMWRVLKPGGLLVHEAETLSQNLLYHFALKDIDLFFRYFMVEISGHFGLENPAELIARFEKLGAQKIKVEIIYDLILPLHQYLRLFDNEYREKSTAVKLLVATAKLASKTKASKLFVEGLLAIISKLGKNFRPLTKAKDLGLCFKKPF